MSEPASPASSSAKAPNTNSDYNSDHYDAGKRDDDEHHGLWAFFFHILCSGCGWWGGSCFCRWRCCVWKTLLHIWNVCVDGRGNVCHGRPHDCHQNVFGDYGDRWSGRRLKIKCYISRKWNLGHLFRVTRQKMDLIFGEYGVACRSALSFGA